MANEPKVTGLSPMTGPPGTKITVRGENFGKSSEDIIKLTIHGADCLPYLEWKSSKKIITRCTRALGSGDIVITTNSGGIGTCDVQFNCYEEVVGSTDESAVWVDEIAFQTPEKEKLIVPGSNEEYSVDISSTRFKPNLFLLHNHSNANIFELEKLHKTLRSDLANKSDPTVISSSSNRAAIFKSNLPTTMECLQIIEHLSKVMTTSRDTSIDNTARSIKQTLAKTHELFDPLLAQKDLVQSVESAMQVIRQNETLFNLPSAIENSIKTKNYDSVVQQISGVLSRLKAINVNQISLIEKKQNDVATKVNLLKATIESQLQESCLSSNETRNIDEVKRLIGLLRRLGTNVKYDLWVALTEMSQSLISGLSDEYQIYSQLHSQELKPPDSKSPSQKQMKTNQHQSNNPPPVVNFVRSAMKLFHCTYYDILALGQSYFDSKDEFCCKDDEEARNDKLTKFDEMISEPIVHLCTLLRLSLIPDSPKLEKTSVRAVTESENYVDWLKDLLQSVITCHIHLNKVNLPSSVRGALEDFKEFVFEFRVRSMQVLFAHATRINKNLHHQEDWEIELDDLHGGITKLPFTFERNIVETLRFANETIFETSPAEEKSILKRVDVQATMKELAQSLINSFIDSLDNALIDSREHPVESTRVILASQDSDRVPSKYMNRLLITICNCQFTRDQIFTRLQEEFEKLQGLKMDRVFKICAKKYSDYVVKIMDKFCGIKCNELNKLQKSSKQDELQINLMFLNSQIFLVAPQLVNCLMTSIVNQMQSKDLRL